MNRFCRGAGIMLCAIALNGCATAPSTESLVKNNAAAAVAMPANYRALIAQYILHQRLPPIMLKDALISKPYDDQGVPLLGPGHVPAVCVEMNSAGLFGGRAYMLFTIRDGRVERLYERANGIIFTEGMCPDYTPFHELMQG